MGRDSIIRKSLIMNNEDYLTLAPVYRPAIGKCKTFSLPNGKPDRHPNYGVDSMHPDEQSYSQHGNPSRLVA